MHMIFEEREKGGFDSAVSLDHFHCLLFYSVRKLVVLRL